jgi:hypothetical protein
VIPPTAAYHLCIGISILKPFSLFCNRGQRSRSSFSGKKAAHCLVRLMHSFSLSALMAIMQPLSSGSGWFRTLDSQLSLQCWTRLICMQPIACCIPVRSILRPFVTKHDEQIRAVPRALHIHQIAAVSSLDSAPDAMLTSRSCPPAADTESS